MPETTIASPSAAGRPRSFTKDTLINGKPATVSCLEIDGQTYALSKGPITVAALEDEWCEDVRDPQAVLSALSAGGGFKPDLFTFWQRIPEIEPKFAFYRETEDLAVLPVSTYEQWWNHQIKSRVRNLIRKTEKEGVEVRETAFDDAFVNGMTAIFNESPVRQGRGFWHYGKDFETVKRQFSRFLYREDMIGAYYGGELVGFVMLANAGSFALPGQIIASLRHRDKAVTNALMAKSVEVCAKRQLPYLVYFYWSDDSLAEFKRRCGFEKVGVPRYYVPLTLKGKMALKLGLHRGLKAALPERIKTPLKNWRRRWNESRKKP